MSNSSDPITAEPLGEPPCPAPLRAGTFSLRSLMLLMTFFSCLMTVWVISIPLGILATLLFVPTIIRANYVAYLWRKEGEEIGTVDFLGLCGASLGVLIITLCSCLYLAGIFTVALSGLFGLVRYTLGHGEALFLGILLFFAALVWPGYYLLRPSLWDGPRSSLVRKPIRTVPQPHTGDREP